MTQLAPLALKLQVDFYWVLRTLCTSLSKRGSHAE